MPIRAAIFDRDGVLTDFDFDAAARFFGRLLPISLQELMERWTRWHIDGAPGRPEREHLHTFWERLGDELDLEQDVRAQLHAFDYGSILEPYPDARPALAEARRRGLLVCVLSNFTLGLEASLHRVRLADLIDVVCAARVVGGVAKPGAAAYLGACRELAVAPEECVFFDDEEPNVEAARALGMISFLVDRRAGDAETARSVIRDLSRWPEHLAATDPATSSAT